VARRRRGAAAAAEKELIPGIAGKRESTDYTSHSRRVKISGAEGFLVMFRIGGTEDRMVGTSAGGSIGGRQSEAGGTLDSKRGHIEPTLVRTFKLP